MMKQTTWLVQADNVKTCREIYRLVKMTDQLPTPQLQSLATGIANLLDGVMDLPIADGAYLNQIQNLFLTLRDKVREEVDSEHPHDKACC